MPINSRAKGQRGEREIIQLLQPVVTEVYSASGLDRPILQRNTLQSDMGGYDIVGLPWAAMEVKWVETLQVYKWWQQCLRQAKSHETPILFYRQTRGVWKVRMFGALPCGSRSLVEVPVTVSIEDFLVWFRLRLVEEISRG